MRSRKRPNQSREKDPPRYIFRTIFLRDRSCDFSKNRANAASYPKQTLPLSIHFASQLSDSVRGLARRPKSENSRHTPLETKNRNFSEIEVAISPRIAQTPRRILFQHLRDRSTLAHNSPTASATTQEDQNQRTVETHLSPAKIEISPR